MLPPVAPPSKIVRSTGNVQTKHKKLTANCQMKNTIQRLLEIRLFGKRHAVRFAGLIFIALSALSAAACSESADGSEADPVTGPARYEISSQADFDALEAVVFNGGDQYCCNGGAVSRAPCRSNVAIYGRTR